MNHDAYASDYIRDILTSCKTIALVGASADEHRPSYNVMGFLLGKGYHVLPVNPAHAGNQILGQFCYQSLSELPEPVDMVDVFREASHFKDVVDEAVAMIPRPKVIWGQLTVRDDVAAAKAERAGIKVVMDRCPVTEFPLLYHALHG
jgi:uncharacterized protein